MSAPPRGQRATQSQSSALSIGLPDQVVEAIAQRAAAIVTEQLAEDRQTEPFIGVEAAAAYIDAPTSRVYNLVSAKRIPFHKDGSRLLFKRVELDAWVAAGGGRRT